jgi:hypothetical protein
MSIEDGLTEGARVYAVTEIRHYLGDHVVPAQANGTVVRVVTSDVVWPIEVLFDGKRHSVFCQASELHLA